jgi:tetratricopeptide (TPR) repeat protein
MVSTVVMDASGYTARQVAQLLGLPEARVRLFVEEQFIVPEHGPRGEERFSFQDLVILRAAKGLDAAHISPTRVRRALRTLKEQLPADRPLSGISVAADGKRLVVRDGERQWNPESGQILFDFQISELVDRVAPLPSPQPNDGVPTDAEGWYAAGVMLESADPARSIAAYRQGLALDPTHPDAHINLGRLLQEAGDLPRAEAHYRAALGIRTEDATAWFNLGTVLEDQHKWAAAADAYHRAVTFDPACADAYFNLAMLYDGAGRKMEALRLLKTYRQLARG